MRFATLVNKLLMALLPTIRPNPKRNGHFFWEKIMYELQSWYPFIEAMLVLVAAFIVITLDIMNNDAKLRKEQKAMRHRDKLHFAIMQSRGVM
jgi:hypothetical protein